MRKAELTERPDLATLVEVMAGWGTDTAVVEHRGVRRFQTSYRELARLAQAFAAELERRGIVPGERVVLWGANSAEWVAAFFGCVLQGVLVVPLDASGDSRFADRVLRDVRPRLTVGDGNLLRLLGHVSPPVPALHLESLRKLPGIGERLAGPRLTTDTPLQILFTSGTTGDPKGVVHTHGNLLASLGPIEREIAKYRRYERWVHPLRFLHTLPLSHVFGQFMGLWVAPVLGAAVHYENRVTGARMARLIRSEGVNVLAAVPRSLALLRGHLLGEHPELEQALARAAGEPLARRWWRFRRVHRALGLRFWAAVCGGATLPEDLERFWTTLGFAVVQGYGLTETAALVTLNHPFRSARGRLGRPLPGRELRVGATGELEVKGDMVSTASWEGGELVARESPWLQTGDLAALDEEGQLRFLGRSGQRLVTAAGLNVYLQDVEAALEAEPELAAAVVFALTGLSGGEEPGAVVVAAGGYDCAAAAVDRANATLAPHQQVRRWWVWPELQLPRTSAGKVRRAEVESWVRSRAFAEPGSTPGNDPVVRLLESVGARPKAAESTEDAARLDEQWGLDSMGRVALAAALEERLGVVAEPARVETVGDLRALLAGKRAVSASALELPSASEPVPTAAASGEISKGPGRQRHALKPSYPVWPWWAPVQVVRRAFVEGFLRPMVAMLAAPRVRVSSPLGRGPLLFVANHRTAMDVPLLLYALPLPLRGRVAVAMSAEMLGGWEGSWRPGRMPPAFEEHRHWWGPVAAFLLRGLLNVFPLPRTVGFRDSFAHAGRAMDRGYSVLIFPEGRRGPDPTATLPFKPGLGILAQEAYLDVVPAALRIVPKSNGGWLRSHPVVHLRARMHVEAGEDAERLTERFEQAVQELLREDSV